MKYFLAAMLCLCVFAVAGLFVWGDEAKVPKHSIVGTWDASIGNDVHYEFVVDETHLSIMGEKVKYTAVYERNWVLLTFKVEKEKIALLLEFHGADKLEVFCVGASPKGEFSLTRKK